jgi:YVTN family beta-propeller protein
MKTIITWTAVFVALAALAFAGVPQTINYQGYLNSKGIPATGPLSMTFSLYSSNPTRNNPVWREKDKPVTVTNGIYSTQLGSVVPITAPFDVPYYLGVQVGADAEMALQPLSSSPYALRAATSDNAASVGGQTVSSLDSRYLDPARPQPTPQQIAALRWDQVRSGVSSVTVGTSPIALAFDGSSIWVANRVDGRVQKINPATGVAGPPITVGSFPYSLAYDGSNMWVANRSSGTVQKINPLNGAVGVPITVGVGPIALAFDGSNLWVVNDNNGNIGTVQKINPLTGTVGAAITVGLNPMAVAFDGSSIWVANFGGSSVQKINPATGIAGPAIAVSSGPRALVFDGSNIWVANFGGGTVQKINPGSGAVSVPITVGSLPTGLAFDGSSIWVANQGSGTVMKINPATGAVGAPITVGTSPVALASDGSNIWVANNASNNITRFAAATVPVGVQTVGAEQISGAIAAANLDLSTVVAKAGDTMTGVFSLPVDGLSVGGTQFVASGGKIAIGGQPTNPALFQVLNSTTGGQAALFQLSNAGNPLPAVYGSTAGSGQAAFALNTGTGRAGHFQIWNAGSNASALVAETNGTGYAGEFLGSMKATGPITSTVVTGTAPFTITSTTQVNNLNAAMVGGKSAGDFVLKAGDTLTGQLVLPASGVKFSDNSTQATAKTDCMGRYEDNGDGTATDCRTGLIWLKNANCIIPLNGIDKSAGVLTWANAVAWTKALGQGFCGLQDGSGPGDWRLPYRTEWMQMVSSARKQLFSNPALTNRAGTAQWTPGDLFDNVDQPYVWFWSFTQRDASTAWGISLGDYGQIQFDSKLNTAYVWPVRSGQ